MKILILSPWFLPAYKAGGPVQSLSNMIKQVNEGIVYSVLTSNLDIDSLPIENVQADVWLPFGSNAQVNYLSKKGRARSVIKLIKAVDPELIFITGIYSPVFTILPLLVSRHCRIVISPRGMLHPPALQKKSFKKKFYLFFLRPLTRFRNVLFHATDETEERHIRSAMGGATPVAVAANIPTLYDLSFCQKSPGSLHLITIALIGPMKNHLLVLKALMKMEGEVHYHICGPVYNQQYWEKCNAVIAGLPPNIHIHYHGPISPADVPAYLAKAHVFICPSESENFGHALIEGMSAGKPLITSNHTPWNRLGEFRAGLNVHTDAIAIRESILFFLKMGNEEYQNWSLAAASHARGIYDLDAVRKQYLNLFNKN